MSDTNATVPTQETNAEGQTRTFTQDEVNAIVGKRLAEEKGKYADYDVLKAKALKFDEAEEASKTELQKATERATALETELNGLKKAEEIRVMRENVAKYNANTAARNTENFSETIDIAIRFILLL